MKLRASQLVAYTTEIVPVNLHQQFEEVAEVCSMPPLRDEPMEQPTPAENEPTPAEIEPTPADDALSIVSDFEVIQNQATKKLAYEARKQLKNDLNEQAQTLIMGHVG